MSFQLEQTYLHSGEIRAKLVGFKKKKFCFIKDTDFIQILP